MLHPWIGLRWDGMAADNTYRLLPFLLAMHLQARSSANTPLVTCLLEGPAGTGKTALAATLAIESGFPFVKVLSAEAMVGYSESAKCSQIAKVFDDAYKVGGLILRQPGHGGGPRWKECSSCTARMPAPSAAQPACLLVPLCLPSTFASCLPACLCPTPACLPAPAPLCSPP